MILPLDSTGRIYVLEDEKGQIIGTGSREACAALMDLIANAISPTTDQNQNNVRTNVHAAITMVG
jgi:hypothetical protein